MRGQDLMYYQYLQILYCPLKTIAFAEATHDKGVVIISEFSGKFRALIDTSKHQCPNQLQSHTFYYNIQQFSPQNH